MPRSAVSRVRRLATRAAPPLRAMRTRIAEAAVALAARQTAPLDVPSARGGLRAHATAAAVRLCCLDGCRIVSSHRIADNIRLRVQGAPTPSGVRVSGKGLSVPTEGVASNVRISGKGLQ
jgi:hypothetical protein